jgi:hypothetical protein
MSTKTWLTLGLGAALLAAPVAAQTTSIIRSQTETTTNAIQNESRQAVTPHVQGNVAYVSGGIGDEGVAAMREVEPGYNLRLTFAMGSRQYLADVRVKLEDPQGRTVLDAVSEGPYFFAKVPAGHYRIVADAEGTPIAHSVDVRPGAAASQAFFWRG